ncbi:thymidine kinase [Actinomadura kijaniata]|uniref:thymidine kinase n=1 Tax=Actinomadura kijaniata TaxID=46161 RepID=UPI003F1D7E42
MAELVFFTGTMDVGKSTILLQEHHSRGGGGLLYSKNDRAGAGYITSRLGLKADAIDVTDDLDLYDDIAARMPVPYVLCDEAQFYSPKQIGQLAGIVDGLGVEVLCYGILTDFRGRLFEGSRRLVELADRVTTLPVSSRCWCGRRATHNARTVDGVMVHTGDLVLVGEDEYVTLCRHHFMAGLA